MAIRYDVGDRFSFWDEYLKKTIHRVVTDVKRIPWRKTKGKQEYKLLYTFETDPPTYMVEREGKEKEYKYTTFTLTGIQLRQMVKYGSLTPVKRIKREDENKKRY